ncbi:hypothetical protein [Spirillospora sp. CA-294931]|uniref:hypothetical protein n=1 Tax=Spirillospora sp. CA-294931 TaxID=3240042 RepID=UPI003D8F9D9A
MTDVCKSAVADQLKLVGWNRVSKKRDLFLPSRYDAIVPQFFINISFNREANSVAVLPLLGIRHSETSDLRGKFLGRSPSSTKFTSTVGCDLLQFTPRDESTVNERWTAFSIGDADRVGENIVEDFQRLGIPFLSSFGSLGDIRRFLNGRNRSQNEEGTLAILAMLEGEREEALSALTRYAAFTQDQSPPLSTQSQGFIRSFVEHFEVGAHLITW